jgi:uncharacterized protein (TIGR03437 family)
MKPIIVSFLLVATAAGYDISPVQPNIPPNGVVNAASYLSPGFVNYGIARGSLFLIFGNYLGPDTLVQASTFPLHGIDGLAGTRVNVSATGYTGYALMVYTSAKQVAAILPSNVPEGDAIVTVQFQNLASNPIVIHVVRSAFGLFTLSQAGVGPGVIQNFVSANDTPLNTLLNSAAPGQTVILWGTGLGPVSGDEAGGPLPGPLPYLDALYVGGQPARVRFAGRSGCCAGVDQIVFDVPSNISGCYLPVVAVTNGITSNSGTIAVSNAGKACDDSLSFRAADLSTLSLTGRLRAGSIGLWSRAAPGASPGSGTLSGSFVSYTPQTLAAAQAPLNPSAGSCYAMETPVTFDPGVLPHGDALNAGFNLMVSGPGGSYTADWVAPGAYRSDLSLTGLPVGVYSASSPGGPDVGSIRGSTTTTSPARWTNASDYAGTFPIGQPITIKWSGGASNAFVAIRINSANTTISTSILCNLPASLATFTVPDYLARLLVQGAGTISVGSYDPPGSFAANGLDTGTMTVGTTTSAQTNFQTPPGGALQE